MNTFYQVNTPADEIRYFKRVSALNHELRNKYDGKYLQEHEIQTENEKKIQPITKPMLESVHQQKLLNATIQRQNNKKNRHVIKVKPSKSKYHQPKKNTKVETSISKSKYQPKKNTKVETSIDSNVDVHAILSQPNIDKYFGLSVDSNNRLKFLGKNISITGKGFKVTGERHFANREIQVPTQRIWSIILDNPVPIEPTPKELETYGSILTILDFHSFLNHLSVGKRRAATRSNKYKYIIHEALELHHSGEGLMYTKRKPTSYPRSNIEFFPTDKRQLLKRLGYLVGEYQSGNTGLRSEIVPIVQYLKNKKALPKKYKSKNYNWIFD